MTLKKCAWISRHPPMGQQRSSLAAYKIAQINPPGRLWSAADAVVLAQNQFGGCWPDLFVVVMPLHMLQHFVELVDGRAPVVRGVYNNTPYGVEWTGKWERITCVRIEKEHWTPNRKEL